MSDIDTKDVVGYAADGNISAFKDAIDQIMMDKIQSAVELKRLEVASNFMSPDSEEELGIEGDTDEDQEI